MIKQFIVGGAVVLAAAGCGQMQSKPADSGSAAPATGSAAAAPKPAPAAPAKAGPRDGMTASGEVTDASKVSCGDGPKVKGINDTEGEILGRQAPGSKFGLLKIGMGMKQVTDLAGTPTDQGAYITGRAFIPFYFGNDRHRFEFAYKGWGRLIFAGGSLGDYSGGNLICIINVATESGYR